MTPRAPAKRGTPHVSPSAVAKLISPLEVIVEAPDVNVINPPEATETPETFPVSLVPTERAIARATPPTPAPDDIEIVMVTVFDEKKQYAPIRASIIHIFNMFSYSK